jgi:predicted transcriptional regulator
MFAKPQQTRHLQGAWHLKRLVAIDLYQRGLSFAEIARQLGFTRAYISQKFAKEEVAA